MSILPKNPSEFSSKSKYISTTQLAKFFNVEARELNQIFTNLKWIEKEHYIWWIATDMGKEQGAIEHTPNNRVKYVYWEKKIMENQELISIIKNMVRSYIDNEIYENYIRNHYIQEGYTVWNYAKESKEKNRNITLIAKRKKEIKLIHCRDNQLDISVIEMKSFQKQRQEFIEQNPVFENYAVSLHYVMSGFFLSEDAYEYIEESLKDISYEIIKSEVANQWLDLIDVSKQKK